MSSPVPSIASSNLPDSASATAAASVGRPLGHLPMDVIVQRALARSASVVGCNRALTASFEETLATFVLPLCARLHEHGWFGDTVVAPLPALLASVVRIVERVGTDSENATLRDAAFNVLSAAMRYRTALLATAHQGVLLEQMSNRDVQLLLLMSARLPQVSVTTCELRFETVRNHKVLPRRLRLMNDSHGLGLLEPHWSILESSTATLEILGLAAWTDTVIAPAEDPRFTEAWRQLRLGTMSFADGLRRWLAGQHMAPIRHEDRQHHGSHTVGGMEVTFRAFELTQTGHRLAHAMRTPDARQTHQRDR